MVGLSGGEVAGGGGGGGGGESQVGAWAGLEAGYMSLWLTDFKLHVQGMQGITKSVGLNNSGLLLEIRLVMELNGGGGDWFWGSHR